MKSFKLVFSTLVFALFLTACNKTDSFQEEVRPSNQMDQIELMAALLAPEVATDKGIKIGERLKIQLNSDDLSEEVMRAIEKGALNRIDQIDISQKQFEYIFNASDLSQIPQSTRNIASDRGDMCGYYDVYINGGWTEIWLCIEIRS